MRTCIFASAHTHTYAHVTNLSKKESAFAGLPRANKTGDVDKVYREILV